LQLSDLQSSEVQAAMRRDSYQLHMTNSSSSSSSLMSRHLYHQHHCPVMTRLYPSVGDDAWVSRSSDGGVSRVGVRRLPAGVELMDCGDSGAVCDDVFCSHDDDDCQSHQHRQLFHAWAQYRIAQRGIMVCLSVCLSVCLCVFLCVCVCGISEGFLLLSVHC